MKWQSKLRKQPHQISKDHLEIILEDKFANIELFYDGCVEDQENYWWLGFGLENNNIELPFMDYEETFSNILSFVLDFNTFSRELFWLSKEERNAMEELFSGKMD